MSKLKFETVEDAVKHIEEITTAHKEEVKSLSEKSKIDLSDRDEKIKEMTAHTATIQKERDDAILARDEAFNEVGILSEELEMKSQSKPGAEVVKIGGKNYTLHGRNFNIPGFERMTAAELGKNKDALEYLVKVKSGVLVAAKGS